MWDSFWKICIQKNDQQGLERTESSSSRHLVAGTLQSEPTPGILYSGASDAQVTFLGENMSPWVPWLPSREGGTSSLTVLSNLV